MRPTQREAQAARSLAESILEFYLAMEEGRESRRLKSPREEVAVRVEHVHPPAPQVPAMPATLQDEKPHLMNSRQAAEYLAVGERKLWQLAAPRGPIPVVRHGRIIRFKVKDLNDFVTRSRVKPRKE